ncbi:MAG: metallophosphoesterase [Chlorobium sp.]|nr:metallophosphoesterase [Chlorobium sp.]
MIWLTGDLHGGVTAYHISPAEFKPAKRGDIVICAGDLGGVWWHDYHTNEKHKCDEDYFLESKLRKRVLWLAVDGNHENFARLFGGEFPLVDLFGGKAYKIRENVYYLKRGEIFTIEGSTFLALGGATSHDKNPGWITPALSWSGLGGREWNKGRTEDIDW